jgi:hypothetical protein
METQIIADLFSGVRLSLAHGARWIKCQPSPKSGFRFSSNDPIVLVLVVVLVIYRLPPAHKTKCHQKMAVAFRNNEFQSRVRVRGRLRFRNEPDEGRVGSSERRFSRQRAVDLKLNDPSIRSSARRASQLKIKNNEGNSNRRQSLLLSPQSLLVPQ